jgi:hypothetical protein
VNEEALAPWGAVAQETNKYYVYLFGIKGVTEYKNARSGKLQTIALRCRQFYYKN